MIRLLMATKPRIAPAPDAPCVFLNGLPPASGGGRPAKGSLPLAADEACAKCRKEEGTAHMGACHAVERAAHGGETPERHERASKRRPAPASAVARARRIGRHPARAVLNSRCDWSARALLSARKRNEKTTPYD